MRVVCTIGSLGYAVGRVSGSDEITVATQAAPGTVRFTPVYGHVIFTVQSAATSGSRVEGKRV